MSEMTATPQSLGHLASKPAIENRAISPPPVGINTTHRAPPRVTDDLLLHGRNWPYQKFLERAG